MAQTNFNVGAIANDGTGEPLRQAFQKQQAMNTELYATKADLVAGKVPASQLPTFLTNKWKKEQLSGFIYTINIDNNELSYYELYFVKDDRSKDFSDPNFEVTNNSITINSGFPLDGVVCFYRKIEL